MALTALGVQHALAGTFFEGLHFGLHGGNPALPTNEIGGFAYARVPSPDWLPATDSYGTGNEAIFPLATGPWPPALSVGLWRHPDPPGLLGSLALDPHVFIAKAERLVLEAGTLTAAVVQMVEEETAGAGPVALRALREGAAPAVARLTHASLHTDTPATEANEMVAAPALVAAYAAVEAGTPLQVRQDLLATFRRMVAGDPVAPGYARAPVAGWAPVEGDTAAWAVSGDLQWPNLPVLPVREWQSGGRSVVFPPAGSAWPQVVAVGFAEGPSGPIHAWTSHFIAPIEGRMGTNTRFRVTDLRLTLFDRTRVVPL